MKGYSTLNQLFTGQDLASKLYKEPTSMSTPWDGVEKGHIISKVALTRNTNDGFYHWTNDPNHVSLTERIKGKLNPTHFVYFKPTGYEGGVPQFELGYMPIKK